MIEPGVYYIHSLLALELEMLVQAQNEHEEQATSLQQPAFLGMLYRAIKLLLENQAITDALQDIEAVEE